MGTSTGISEGDMGHGVDLAVDTFIIMVG